MKPLTFLLAAALLALQASCAQNPPYHSHRGQPSVGQLAGELGLTPAQQTQVEQIFESERSASSFASPARNRRPRTDASRCKRCRAT